MLSLNDRLKVVDTLLAQKVGERDLLTKQYKKQGLDLRRIIDDAEVTFKARQLLDVFIKATDVQLRRNIEPLVTEALDFVFNQGLHFHLYSVTRRNQVEYDFIVVRNDLQETQYQQYMQDPARFEDELGDLAKETKNINFMYGGAVNQVLGLILRLILVELFKIEGPVLLDEPSSAVGEEYTARLGQLISSLSRRFGRQIILITHSKTLASFAETIYSVQKENSVSQITQDAD